MEEHFITIDNLVSSKLCRSLATFSSISGKALPDHGSFRKKTPPWTILLSDFDLSLYTSWHVLALIPSGIELQNPVFNSYFWDEVPIRIRVSTLVVFPAGCMSVSNDSPGESLPDRFDSSRPYSLPGSGAVSVFEGVETVFQGESLWWYQPQIILSVLSVNKVLKFQTILKYPMTFSFGKRELKCQTWCFLWWE